MRLNTAEKVLVGLLVAVLCFSLVGFLGVFGARTYLNNAKVPVVNTLVAPGNSERVLAIVAHPDDELLMAGALAQMSKEGADVTLASLTRGEKPTAEPKGFTPEQLTQVRGQEFQRSADALGVEQTVALTFPDSQLYRVPQAELVAAINGLVSTYQPSTVVTLDSVIGLYGDTDRRVAGQAVAAAVVEGAASPDYPVKQLWVPTLSEHVTRLLKRESDTFSTRLEAAGQPLPAPTVALDIGPVAKKKEKSVEAYSTQEAEMDDKVPGSSLIPSSLYYRLFDVEYYHLAWQAS